MGMGSMTVFYPQEYISGHLVFAATSRGVALLTSACGWCGADDRRAFHPLL
jgi:hypothetical protein